MLAVSSCQPSARRRSEPDLDFGSVDGVAVAEYELTDAADRVFGKLFSGRVLPFDAAAARVYADIACRRRVEGRPISQLDCQIAAIARSRGMSVAARDVDGFSGCRIDVINPWAGG